MSDFLNTMGTVFSFLFTQLGNVATFFTTNIIGQIILGVALFSIIVSIVMAIVSTVHK